MSANTKKKLELIKQEAPVEKLRPIIQSQKPLLHKLQLINDIEGKIVNGVITPCEGCGEIITGPHACPGREIA